MDNDRITMSEWVRIRNLLATISSKAADDFRDAVFKSSGKFKGAGLENISKRDLIDYAYALVDYYGDGTATVACELYDQIAALQGAKVLPAVPAQKPTRDDVAQTMLGVLKDTTNEEYVSAVVGRMVKQVGQDTLLQNAVRDGAQFAWIPAGQTCAFCITLASNGWQQASKKTVKNGHAEHIHSNCDCSYCVRFNDNLTVDGYNPEAYRKIYMAADGKDGKTKINSMRRAFYEFDKENGEGTDNSELFDVSKIKG